MYQCQGHPINDILQLQLPYNDYRTCLTNPMGSISCHIMPLVINSLGGGHTQTHIQMSSAQEQFQETRHAPGLKVTSYLTFWKHCTTNLSHYGIGLSTQIYILPYCSCISHYHHPSYYLSLIEFAITTLNLVIYVVQTIAISSKLAMQLSYS